MSTKQILEDYVTARTSEAPEIPLAVSLAIDTIGDEAPYRLKLGIALSELITFASHLRKPIELYDGTLVPVNAIVFALSASGTSKDKSLNAVRKALSKGLSDIEDIRIDYAQKKAQKIAERDGTGWQQWPKFYNEPKPLQAGLGTVEGLMGHFAEIAENPIGAGSVLSSEIGSELQTNASMTDIIKTLSVAYDLGNIPAKIVKSKENQTPGVKGFPVNALFFGSHEAILYTTEIKNKFRQAFTTQLSRRGIFIFTPEVPPQIEIEKDAEEVYKIRQEERERSLEASNKLNELTGDLVSKRTEGSLKLTEDATKLFDIYLEYNSIASADMPDKHPISKISAKHKQWLALKVAGAFALLNGDEEITVETYATAINTVRLVEGDLPVFENELVKESYEQFVDMCNYRYKDEELFLSLHDLRKQGYITGSGSSAPKLDELVNMSNSYDSEGTYRYDDRGVYFQQIVKSDIVGVSYKIHDSSLEGKALKAYMQKHSSNGFEFYETDFEEIESLLEENAAYGCFAFNNGERSKENLTGSTKFIILDIDESNISDEETHTLLSDFNHYVVRTSNKDNAFKFRVLLELDAPLDVDANTWKMFMKEVGDELGLTVDSLPQSQIFFSFANREIHKQLEGETLSTKMFLDRVAAKANTKQTPAPVLTSKLKEAKLENRRDTFEFAYSCESGSGSCNVYKALMYAVKLGADAEYVKELAHSINDYWTNPMPLDRLEYTLITPVLRKIGE